MAFEVLGKIFAIVATAGAAGAAGAGAGAAGAAGAGAGAAGAASAGNGGFLSNILSGMQGQNIVVRGADGSVDWGNTTARALGNRFINGGPARKTAGQFLTAFNQEEQEQPKDYNQ